MLQQNYYLYCECGKFNHRMFDSRDYFGFCIFIPAFTATATPPSVCAGTASNISAGVSAGAFSVASIPYAPHPVPGTGVTTLVHSGIHDVAPSITSIAFDDEGWFNLPIGFNFNFFGVNNTVFHVSSNGNIQFGNTANFSTSFTPGAVPSTALPNNFVGLFWQDLYLAATGTIRYWVDGAAPNRVLVVEFLDVPGYQTVGDQSGQILLYESTGVIETHLGTVTDATHVKVDGGRRCYRYHRLRGSRQKRYCLVAYLL